MKFTVILLALSMIQAIASDVLSQSPGLMMAYSDTDLKLVLDEIERQTDFRFLYENETVANKTVDLDAGNKTWFDILEQIKVASDVDYQVMEDNLIVLTPLKQAQERLITGTITDPDGIPVIGASVVVKGTTIGAISNQDGNYEISVPADATTLIFSYVGMLTSEVELGTQTEISFAFEADLIGLDEVVVIGYGTATKGSLTGAVSTVDSEALSIDPSNNISKALQGKVAGIQVLNDGRPGQNAEVRIRGLGTINNNDPLWIVDGVFATSSPPASMVESVSVLKDAASTAIYGARGANGVILVTTKGGKKNMPINVNFSARVGMTYPHKKLDIMHSSYEEYGEMYWLIAANDGVENPSNPLYGSGPNPVVPDYLVPNGAAAGSPEVDPALYDLLFEHQDGTGIYQIIETPDKPTDWFDEVYQNALSQEYNFSVSGGTERVAYAFSADYTDQEAIVKYSSYNRLSVMANLTFDVNKWLKVGTSNNLGNQVWAGSRGNRGGGSIFNEILLTDAQIPVYDIMGNWAGNRVTGGGNSNPLAVLDRAKDDTNKRTGINGSIYAQIAPVKGLKIKTLFGYSVSSYRNNNITYADPENYKPNPYNSLMVSTGNSSRWNWTNTIDYTLTFDRSRLELLGGTEAIRSESLWQTAGREGFFTTDPDFMYLDGGTGLMTNTGNGTEWTLFSLFARAHYDFASKYLVDATIRRDGSSRFGSENRYAVFPAFAAGWRISNESFMSGSENWLTSLKLRASWGKSGNDQIGDYNGFTTFGSSNTTSYYPIDGQDNAATAGYQSITFGNPAAKWETTQTTDVAVDASFFGILNVTLDLWTRTTYDMLFRQALPYVNGRANIPYVNVGEMNNKGFDLLLNVGGQSESGDFFYDISAVVSRYKNQIVKLSGEDDEFLTGDSKRVNQLTRAENGTAFPEFYGYEVDGIFMTQAEADGWAETFGPGGTYNEPGHWRFLDKNGRDEDGNLTGVPDGVVDDADRDYLGTPHPDFTGGLNVLLGYKAFDLTLEFYGSYGGEIFADHRVYLENSTGGSASRSSDRLYKSWGSPYLSDNADAIMPKIETDDAANLDAVNHYLEDGSFLKLRNLQIGYNTPASFNNKLKMKSVRVYFMISNLFTLTKYSGLDPEVGSYLDNNQDPGMTKGIDTGTWPIARQFMLGINIGL